MHNMIALGLAMCCLHMAMIEFFVCDAIPAVSVFLEIFIIEK